MQTCLLFLCLSLGGGADRAEPDRLFGEDKLKHFFTSFIATSLAASGARAAGLDREASLVAGAVVGVGVGAGKELWDRRRPQETASWLDLAWDLAGVGAATVVVAQSQ